MVDVRTETVINRPIDIVAGFAANPDHAPEWYVNIKSVEWKTAPQLSVGARVAFRANFMARELSYTYEIVSYVPLQSMMMRTAEGPFPMETTYTWKRLDEVRTLMTLRNAGAPSGFSKIMAPLMSFMMKRANRADLKRLKQILESR